MVHPVTSSGEDSGTEGNGDSPGVTQRFVSRASTDGKGLLLPAVVDSRYVFFLSCKLEKSEGKGQRAGFLEAGGSFKAVLVVASLTLFPWEQPAGQLVPVNLSPGGASALTGRRSWPTPWLAEGRGPQPRGLSPFYGRLG